MFAEKGTISKYTNEQFIQLGDILINSTGTGTVGRTGIVKMDLFKIYQHFVADSHVTVVRSNSLTVPQYIWFVLISPLIQKDIEKKCTGSTNQIELATSTIKNYLIPFPPANEQKRISKRLIEIYDKLKDEI